MRRCISTISLVVAICCACGHARDCARQQRVPLVENLGSAQFKNLRVLQGGFTTGAILDIASHGIVELTSAVAVVELYGEDNLFLGSITIQSTAESGSDNLEALPMKAWIENDFPRHRISEQPFVKQTISGVSPTMVGFCIKYAKIAAVYTRDAHDRISVSWHSDWNFQPSILETSSIPPAINDFPSANLIASVKLSAAGIPNAVILPSAVTASQKETLESWLLRWRFLPGVKNGAKVESTLKIRLRLFPRVDNPVPEVVDVEENVQDVEVRRQLGPHDLIISVAGLPLT
jgi:hypothetical protein